MVFIYHSPYHSGGSQKKCWKKTVFELFLLISFLWRQDNASAKQLMLRKQASGELPTVQILNNCQVLTVNIKVISLLCCVFVWEPDSVFPS